MQDRIVVVDGPQNYTGNKVKFGARRRKKDGGYHYVVFIAEATNQPSVPRVLNCSGSLSKPLGRFHMEYDCHDWEEADVTDLIDEEVIALGKSHNLTPSQALQLYHMRDAETLMRGDIAEIKKVLGARTASKVVAHKQDLISAMNKSLGISVGLAKALRDHHGTKLIKAEPFVLLDTVTVNKIEQFVLEHGLGSGNKYKHIAEAVRERQEITGQFSVPVRILKTQAAAVFGRPLLPIDWKLLGQYYKEEKRTGNWVHEDTLANISVIRDWQAMHQTASKCVSVSLSSSLNADQTEAVKLALTERISCIAGAAGTGKTTALRGLLDALDDTGKTYTLVAPSGKASSRMREVTGRHATTIHHAVLQKEDNTDYVIIDEASMLDINILAEMIKLNPNAHYVFIGDNHQLPPVGPGEIFIELLDSVPSVHLQRVYRQDSDSPILRVASNIRTEVVGICPGLEMIRVDNEEIPGLIQQRFMSGYQILTPYRNGEGGSKELNKLWTQHNKAGKDTFASVSGVYAVGDKVMHVENTHNGPQSVYNGETGVVIEANKNGMTVDYKRITIKYTLYSARTVRHAYAVTVHKSQGSEFDKVVLVLPYRRGTSKFLSKQLLYTAVTRAKKELIVIGQPNLLFPLRWHTVKHQRVKR
jgi:ribosomal protein L21E